MKLNNVYKSIKVLYRLEQALHIWYETFIKFLETLEFIQLKLDHKIFVLEDMQLFISVYFNDSIVFGLKVSRLENIKQSLWDEFKMTDL